MPVRATFPSQAAACLDYQQKCLELKERREQNHYFPLSAFKQSSTHLADAAFRIRRFSYPKSAARKMDPLPVPPQCTGPNRGLDVVAAESVVLTLVVLTTLFRAYVRSFIIRIPGWDDALLALSVVGRILEILHVAKHNVYPALANGT